MSRPVFKWKRIWAGEYTCTIGEITFQITDEYRYPTLSATRKKRYWHWRNWDKMGGITTHRDFKRLAGAKADAEEWYCRMYAPEAT